MLQPFKLNADLEYCSQYLVESCVFPRLTNSAVYAEYVGDVVNGRLPLGYRIYVSCNAGYDLIGSVVNYCQTSEEWSPGNFSCKCKNISPLLSLMSRQQYYAHYFSGHHKHLKKMFITFLLAILELADLLN